MQQKRFSSYTHSTSLLPFQCDRCLACHSRLWQCCWCFSLCSTERGPTPTAQLLNQPRCYVFFGQGLCLHRRPSCVVTVIRCHALCCILYPFIKLISIRPWPSASPDMNKAVTELRLNYGVSQPCHGFQPYSNKVKPVRLHSYSLTGAAGTGTY